MKVASVLANASARELRSLQHGDGATGGSGEDAADLIVTQTDSEGTCASS